MLRAPSSPYARIAPYLLAVGAFILVRVVQVKYLGWGTGFDVGLYASYAQTWAGGSAPYVGFHPEYPPGALLSFLPALLVGGPSDYAHWFAIEMSCFDLLACLLVVRTVLVRFPMHPGRAALAAGLYLAMSAALFPVLYTRFDLVPAVVTLAAVTCALRGRHGWSAFLIGVAGAIKLWPFALGPLWVLVALRRRGSRAALWTCVLVGLGALVIAIPVLPRAGWAVLEFLKYHEQRGIQIETTWSTVALVLNALHLTAVHPQHSFGAFHVAGPLATKFAAWSMPALVVAVLAPVAVLAIRNWRSAAQPGMWIPAMVATVLGFMVAGKVLSPQFILWIVPLLPLTARRPLGLAVVLVIAVLTSVVYPYWSPALEQREPGHVRALVAVGVRNALLVGLYVVFLVRSARRPTLL